MHLLSVIIPAFNAETTIRRSVESTPPDAEVIVVDDGSTDSTSEAVGALADRVRYIRQESAGPNVARNRGAALASGDYLVFLDADDELLAGWRDGLLEMIVDRVALASCGVVIRDVQSGMESTRPPVDKGPAYDHIVASFLPGSYAVRSDVFDAAGAFAVDISYGEHHELGLRLAPLCVGSVASIPEALVLKHHDRSATRRRSYHAARLASSERKLERHGARLARDPLLFADYQRVGAYSAASMGEYRRARQLYLAAARSNQRRWKDLARAAVTLVPLLRKRLWD